MNTAVSDAITLHEIFRKSNFTRENRKSIEVSVNIEEAVIAGIATNERLYVATVGINEIFEYLSIASAFNTHKTWPGRIWAKYFP